MPGQPSPYRVRLFSHGPRLQGGRGTQSNGACFSLRAPHQGTRRDSTPLQIFVLPPNIAWLMEGGVWRDCCVIPSQKEAEMFPGCLYVSTEKGSHQPLLGKANLEVPKASSLPAPTSQSESTHCAKSLSSCHGQIPSPWRSWGPSRDWVLFHTCWHDGPRD